MNIFKLINLSPIAIILHLTIGISVFFIAVSILGFILDKRNMKRRFSKEEASKRLLEAGINSTFSKPKARKFREDLEEMLRFTNLSWGFHGFVVYSFLSGVIGAVLGTVYLNNISTALPLLIVFSLIPLLIIKVLVSKKRAALEKQMVPAIELFISDFGKFRNVLLTLDNMIPSLERPLQDEFSRLAKELHVTSNVEETLFNFAARLDSIWAYRFALILYFRMESGIDISSVLLNQIEEMSNSMYQAKKRKVALTGVNLETMMIYAAIPFMYWFATKLNPQSHYLLTQTPGGRKVMLILVSILSCSLLLTMKLNNTRVKS